MRQIMYYLDGCPVAERLVDSEEGDAARLGKNVGTWCSGLLDFIRAVSEENPITDTHLSPEILTGFMNIAI